VHARIPNGQPREEKRVGGQVGEDCRACPAHGKLNGEVAGHADFRARILARMSARMSVSVSVPWNLSLITQIFTSYVAYAAYKLILISHWLHIEERSLNWPAPTLGQFT